MVKKKLPYHNCELKFSAMPSKEKKTPIKNLASTIDYHRTEVRLDCEDFEMMPFSIVGAEHEKLSMVVLNKSNSGLGCSCYNHSALSVGIQLNLHDIIIYEIRWIQRLTDHVINIGLKIVRELI